MKIAIVCGHFMPEVGYQEVYLARAFARLGHQVRVFTSDLPSPSVTGLAHGRYPAGESRDEQLGYAVFRLRASMSVGASVLGRGLSAALGVFDPDIVAAIGVGKLFPLPVLRRTTERRYRLLTLFGDNRDFLSWSSPGQVLRSLRSLLLQRLAKDRVYARAVRASDRVVLYTPETGPILRSRLPADAVVDLDRKEVSSTLGFDPGEFYFHAGERETERARIAAAEGEVVVISATRVTRAKRLESMVTWVSRLQASGHRVRAVLVGFMGDGYDAALRSFVARQPRPDTFQCLPFLGHERIRILYAAADLGLWLRPAISIQEAMGTGLPLVLERKPALSHLLEEGLTGWYGEPGALEDTLGKGIREIAALSEGERRSRRMDIAARNAARFSYDTIARDLIRHALA